MKSRPTERRKSSSIEFPELTTKEDTSSLTGSHTPVRKLRGMFYSKVTVTSNGIKQTHDVYDADKEQCEIKVRTILVQAGVYK